MSDSRPNIVLFMTDQQRGDCLGIEGHPVLQTPYLDHVAASGVRFARAYTACPICVAARRTLLSGQRPSTHGVVSNHHCLLEAPTLPGELSRAGYQTHLVGKLHFWPDRKLYGFNSADWADSPVTRRDTDYRRFLLRNGVLAPDAAMAHGANQNGWVARPWHLEERLSFSNWCADCAMEFFERRDPTVPFFLNVSFHSPHQPCCPPAAYYDRYMAMDLPEPVVGDWAKCFDRPQMGQPVDSWRTALTPQLMKQYRAGYFGSINHVDDQIGRVMSHLPANTIVVFCSDHGDMLGDHQWIRKRSPYEPSARIPLLMRFPGPLNVPAGQVRDEPVELMDVMPTLLEAAGAAIPTTVEGRSVLPLLRGQSKDWRPYVHGECYMIPTAGTGMQYLTDGKRKYIYLPGLGQEQFFDLEADPREMHDLAGQPAHQGEVATRRERLIRELVGRPEGFTDGRRLLKLPGPTAPSVPKRA